MTAIYVSRCFGCVFLDTNNNSQDADIFLLREYRIPCNKAAILLYQWHIHMPYIIHTWQSPASLTLVAALTVNYHFICHSSWLVFAKATIKGQRRENINYWWKRCSWRCLSCNTHTHRTRRSLCLLPHRSGDSNPILDAWRWNSLQYHPDISLNVICHHIILLK